MRKIENEDVRRASRRVVNKLVIDRRVRWFVRVYRRWVPMTAVFCEAAQLDSCHTYRAQGAFEILGRRVKRVSLRRSIRLQQDLILYP